MNREERSIEMTSTDGGGLMLRKQFICQHHRALLYLRLPDDVRWNRAHNDFDQSGVTNDRDEIIGCSLLFFSSRINSSTRIEP
jgi:hypothetical protein